MEQSTFEAVMIGVNAFVFIIALTAGILLMSSVVDMVNFANERAIVGMNGTVAESVGVVEDRIYTGAQMLTYYREKVERLEQERQELNYEFGVKLSELGTERKLSEFIQNEPLKNYYNKQFILQYKGKESGKDTYVFFGQAENNQG